MMMLSAGGGGGLPPEYQQVAFLQSNGNQYIDTGILCENYKYRIGFGYVKKSQEAVFGAGEWDMHFLIKVEDGENGAVDGVIYANDSSRICWIGYLPERPTTRIAIRDAGIVQCVLDFPNNEAYCETTDKYIGAEEAYLKSLGEPTNKKIILFGRDGYNGIKTWSYQIANFSAEGVTNLISCYRKSDGKPGMYDTITGEFRTNSGSGELIPGPTTDRWGAWLDDYSWDGWNQIFEKVNGWHCSTLLPVTGGDVIKLEHSGGLGDNLYFFDSRLNVVDKIISNWGGTYTTPAGAKYAAWSSGESYHAIFNLTTGEAI